MKSHFKSGGNWVPRDFAIYRHIGQIYKSHFWLIADLSCMWRQSWRHAWLLIQCRASGITGTSSDTWGARERGKRHTVRKVRCGLQWRSKKWRIEWRLSGITKRFSDDAEVDLITATKKQDLLQYKFQELGIFFSLGTGVAWKSYFSVSTCSLFRSRSWFRCQLIVEPRHIKLK